jgi:hypothetical protein
MPRVSSRARRGRPTGSNIEVAEPRARDPRAPSGLCRLTSPTHSPCVVAGGPSSTEMWTGKFAIGWCPLVFDAWLFSSLFPARVLPRRESLRRMMVSGRHRLRGGVCSSTLQCTQPLLWTGTCSCCCSSLGSGSERSENARREWSCNPSPGSVAGGLSYAALSGR